LVRNPNFQSLVELDTGGGTKLLPALRHCSGNFHRPGSAES
jgi:hypothetical protein